jgi:phage tail P2-like protein
VDTWDSTWPEHTKRSVVASAIPVARLKGTKKAVSDALASLGAGAVMVEWFEKSPAGTPHTFTVNIVSNDTSVAMQAAMVSEIDRTKPLRSHYDIVFGVAAEGDINIVGIFRPAVFVRLDGGATY